MVIDLNFALSENSKRRFYSIKVLQLVHTKTSNLFLLRTSQPETPQAHKLENLNSITYKLIEETQLQKHSSKNTVSKTQLQKYSLSMSKTVLITGGSSNLGLSCGKRLIDNLGPEEKITIIITSRTLPKALETIDEINDHGKKLHRSMQTEFDYILVDFSDMVSVLSAYYELNKKYKRIDCLVLNAVQTCYGGVDWMVAVTDLLKDPVKAVSDGNMKIQKVGRKSGDGMGLLFQGNVFGPYFLIHKLKHLLQGGKIIWVSSIVSGPEFFSFEDIQLLQNRFPYEGSKRLVDLIHMGTYKSLNKKGIKQYIVNPGIFSSFAFYQYLNFVTFYGMLALFYLARFLGSTIHNITGYHAANSIVSCYLNDDEVQEKKIVSSTTRGDKEYLAYTEIDATGAEDVVAYLDKLCDEWDEKFKDQIVNTRLP